MSDDVAHRLRALADAPWIARGDAATQAALREGAAEVERQAAALMATEARLTSALHACGDVAAHRAEVRGAIAAAARFEGMFQRMVQPALATLRERDALRTEADHLRLALSGAQYREREALAVVAMLRARLDRALDDLDAAENRVENLEIARTIGPRVDEVRAALAQATAPDLAALARREAGVPPTGRAWTVTVGEGSEGR